MSALYKADLLVNGERRSIEIEPRVSLLDALRENLKLTGTKKGCNQGACGACTVLVDGQRKLSCLTLAVQVEGKAITTIEGLTDNPLLQAFVKYDGFQCGYCTPGQICSAVGMCNELEAGTPSYVSHQGAKESTTSLHDGRLEEIKERMSGNLCRCGAYNGIVESIEAHIASKYFTSSEKHKTSEIESK